ncbi:unnamed protein product [Phytophthora lilii]|uniref:Unnamed protein product n=1 Tax=Phytophthora lilii TaxID=2077276 RepID=A0A9W6XVQ2_9STRA|nr:unnamed protein product [Phytophthora lilii]
MIRRGTRVVVGKPVPPEEYNPVAGLVQVPPAVEQSGYLNKMSSGFSYPQPTFQSSIYNPAFYLTLDASGYLTFGYAQTLYLSKDDYRMSYLSGVVPGTASIGSALVLGASGNIFGIISLSATNLTGTLQTASQPNITSVGNLSFNGSSRSISITGASSYIDCREYRQNGNTYDLSLLQYISGVSFGSATANKFLSCDSSLNISNLNTLSATTITCTNLSQGSTYYDLSSFLTSVPSSLGLSGLYTTGNIDCDGFINGFLAYGNQSQITTVGSLTELGINSTATNEYFSIKGSGLSYLDGSYTRMLTFSGSNITPVQFQIQVHNGTNSTPSNATWIGNYTNNDLRFGINNSTAMILTTTGRLGVGTTTPSAPLHIVGSNTYVFGAGGLTVYRLH